MDIELNITRHSSFRANVVDFVVIPVFIIFRRPFFELNLRRVTPPSKFTAESSLCLPLLCWTNAEPWSLNLWLQALQLLVLARYLLVYKHNAFVFQTLLCLGVSYDYSLETKKAIANHISMSELSVVLTIIELLAKVAFIDSNRYYIVIVDKCLLL